MRKLGYLSAAPRVSTDIEAELSGPRNHVLGVISGFEELGWEVKRFIVGDRMPGSWIKRGSESSFRRAKWRVLFADVMRLVLGVINARRAWQRLGKDVDWVYERFAVLQSLGWIFKHHGIPWILETNGPGFIEAADRKTLVLTSLAKWLEIKAYRRCDFLVCITNTLKDIIVEEAKISPEKVMVLPNGVNLSLFNPQHYQAKYEFEGFTIGYVGSLVARQGIGLLLEVMQELKRDGLKIYLVIVGEGRLRKELEAKANELGLSDDVKFVGHVLQSEVPAYMLGFDIGYSGPIPLSTGKIFYSPLKQYEYMAMAKPVLASSYEESLRIIQEGGTGFIFKAGDKLDLKRVIRHAYQSKAKFSSMGKKAREEIIDKHGWNARVSSLVQWMDKKLNL